MDFRSKIEARRRELAGEQRQAQQDADAHVAKIAAKLQASREVGSAVGQEGGSIQPPAKVSSIQTAAHGAVMNASINKLVEKEVDRLIAKEGGNGALICFGLGILFCFFSWHGLWLILLSVIWHAVQRSRYRGLAKERVEQAARTVAD